METVTATAQVPRSPSPSLRRVPTALVATPGHVLRVAARLPCVKSCTTPTGGSHLVLLPLVVSGVRQYNRNRSYSEGFTGIGHTVKDSFAQTRLLYQTM